MSYISNELRNAIDEKIMLDVEIHFLNQKILKAEKESKIGFRNYLEQLLKSSIKKRGEISGFLKKNGVKISEPKRVSDMFIEYYYSVKKNGGFFEEYTRYWDKGIQFRLKKRIEEYFERDGKNK